MNDIEFFERNPNGKLHLGYLTEALSDEFSARVEETIHHRIEQQRPPLHNTIYNSKSLCQRHVLFYFLQSRLLSLDTRFEMRYQMSQILLLLQRFSNAE